MRVVANLKSDFRHRLLRAGRSIWLHAKRNREVDGAFVGFRINLKVRIEGLFGFRPLHIAILHKDRGFIHPDARRTWRRRLCQGIQVPAGIKSNGQNEPGFVAGLDLGRFNFAGEIDRVLRPGRRDEQGNQTEEKTNFFPMQHDVMSLLPSSLTKTRGDSSTAIRRKSCARGRRERETERKREEGESPSFHLAASPSLFAPSPCHPYPATDG